jgi:hypothetical protein
MRKFPDHIVIAGKGYSFEKVLKDDFFSVNVKDPIFLHASAGMHF